MELNAIVKKGIDEINKRAKSDPSVKDVLKQYDGRRIFINIVDDTTYAFLISSEEVSLGTSKSANPEDMYIEMKRETIKKLFNREINPLQITSMVFFGKIKIKNIGTKEIDLVKNIISTHS